MQFSRLSSLLLAAAFAVAPLSFAQAQIVVAAQPVAFHIEKRAYFSMSYFNTVDSLGTLSTTVRHNFSPLFWAKYSVLNADGEETGKVSARWLNPSSFFTASGDLDVHDASGQLVGMIRGHFFTWAPARFTIFNAQGEAIADASIDSRVGDCLLTDPKNVGRSYAVIKERSDKYSHNLGFWDVIVEDPTVVDPRLVHALAVYLADYEDYVDMNPERSRQQARDAATVATGSFFGHVLADAYLNPNR